MKQVHGIWLPDHEQHLVEYLARSPRFEGAATYQFHKWERCLPYIRHRRRALDIGAHCGLWSRVMEKHFDEIAAFEPIAEHRECFLRNVSGIGQPGAGFVMLYPFALGDKNANVMLRTGPASSGDTFVSAIDPVVVDDLARRIPDRSAPMRRLDDVIGDAAYIDFVKIDCEGFEYFILQGGERLFREHKPCVIIEQKPGKATEYGLDDIAGVQLLASWGAHVRDVIAGDYIMSWPAEA